MNEIKKFEHTLLNLLCRICGKEDKYCVQVFSDEGVQQQLQKKIRLCLPIVVSYLILMKPFTMFVYVK